MTRTTGTATLASGSSNERTRWCAIDAISGPPISASAAAPSACRYAAVFQLSAPFLGRQKHVAPYVVEEQEERAASGGVHTGTIQSQKSETPSPRRNSGRKSSATNGAIHARRRKPCRRGVGSPSSGT